MSSPIHHPEDLDAALMYAPPWAREEALDRVRDPSPPLAPAGPANAVRAQKQPARRRLSRIDRATSGDLAMARLQRQLALNPDQVPEPPFYDEDSLWPLAGRIGAVGAVAVLVAWVMISLPGTRLMRNDAKSADPPPPAASVSDDTAESVHVASAMFVQHDQPDQNVLPQNVVAPNALPPNILPQPADSPLNAPPFVTPPAPQNIANPQSGSASPALDHDEMTTLVKRGKDFLNNGDLAAARLLLRRAAEAGSAEAALALGATYDPLVLHRLGAIGAQSDVARARQWYQKAAALGSEAASQQLAKLELANQ